VKGLGKTYSTLGTPIFRELATLQKRPVSKSKVELFQSVYFDVIGRMDTPVYKLDNLDIGETIQGPAMVLDDTQTILLDKESEGILATKHFVIRLSD
jgi:5-oxoprolinase (ATP-hydrolysing)